VNITNAYELSFIGALEKVLGSDEVTNHVITYVDDLLIHSATFSDHLYRIDRVLERLTTAVQLSFLQARNEVPRTYHVRQNSQSRSRKDRSH
jgi:hypothetical protein